MASWRTREGLDRPRQIILSAVHAVSDPLVDGSVRATLMRKELAKHWTGEVSLRDTVKELYGATVVPSTTEYQSIFIEIPVGSVKAFTEDLGKFRATELTKS